MIRYVVIQDWVSGSIELRRAGLNKWGRRAVRMGYYTSHDKVLTEPLPLIEAHRKKREIERKGLPESCCAEVKDH